MGGEEEKKKKGWGGVGGMEGSRTVGGGGEDYYSPSEIRIQGRYFLHNIFFSVWPSPGKKKGCEKR